MGSSNGAGTGAPSLQLLVHKATANRGYVLCAVALLVSCLVLALSFSGPSPEASGLASTSYTSLRGNPCEAGRPPVQEAWCACR
jgi:hypothetical protein